MASKEDMLNRAQADYDKWRETSGDYQTRFCYEFVELKDRISRLEKFLNSGFAIKQYQKDRLTIQLSIMKSYLEVMQTRYNDDQL
jgi:hypothetical protein